MAKIHFVSAHFGGEVPWIPEIKSVKHDVTFNYYSDLNTPSRHRSMHPRFKSKIPKMLEWKFVESEWYVWMDSSLKPHKDIDLADEILNFIDDKPLYLFRHGSAKTIREEALRTLNFIKRNSGYHTNRYLGEPIFEQLIHYYGDPDFTDSKLFSSGFFVYHRSVADLMQSWFNEVVHWSLQCQISLPYVLHKSGVEYGLFEGVIDNIKRNRFVIWDWPNREINLRDGWAGANKYIKNI